MSTAARNAGFADEFAFLWSDILEKWYEQYTEAELDVNALLSFVHRAFVDELGQEAFSEKASETADASSAVKPLDSKQPEAVSAQLSEMQQLSGNVEDTVEETNTAAESSCTVRTAVDLPSEPEHMADCAAEKGVSAEKHLHCLIRRWLAAVNLSDSFHTHPAFRYGFYLEYPAFEHIPHQSDAVYAIDALHPQAGNVFAFLSKLSGQEDWLFDSGEGRNPLLMLAGDSKLKIAYNNPDKLDEYTAYGIGERANLLAEVLTWQSDRNHPFCTLLDDILAAVRNLKAEKEADYAQ